MALVSSYLFNEYYYSAPVLGFLTMALYLALRVIASRYIYKRLHSSIVSDTINLEKEDDFGNFKGTNAWRFLFPQLDRADAIYGTVIAALYGASLGFYLNYEHSSNIISNDVSLNIWLILAAFTSSFNGLSLLTGDIHEPADFNTEGSKSILWRSKNLRPSYLILFSLIEVIIHNVTDDHSSILAILRWVYIFTPALFCFALFSVPAASILWLLEKYNLWLAGLHTNSTSFRSLISIIIAVIFAVVSATIYYNTSSNYELPLALNITFGVISAYTGSILYTLALSRPKHSSHTLPFLREAVFSEMINEQSPKARKFLLLKIIIQPCLQIGVGVASVIITSDMSSNDLIDELLGITGGVGVAITIMSMSARLQFNRVSRFSLIAILILLAQRQLLSLDTPPIIWDFRSLHSCLYY